MMPDSVNSRPTAAPASPAAGEWTLDTSQTEPTVSGSELSPSGYVGSMQQVLQENTGHYVLCEFLIGTQSIVRKEGILYAVGVSFLVLHEVSEQRYVVCDFYSLKFITFYESPTGPNRPVPLPSAPRSAPSGR
ncbi:MAG: hypothetical protein RRY21_05695 [Oscillospiraceae bacterium]